MVRATIIFLSLCLITAAESASACDAISSDVAKLGSALNALDHHYSVGGIKTAQNEGTPLGDVVVCAAEAAVSTDRARKVASLMAINQIEEYLGVNMPPMIHSAIDQIKAAIAQVTLADLTKVSGFPFYEGQKLKIKHRVCDPNLISSRGHYWLGCYFLNTTFSPNCASHSIPMR